MNTTDAIHTWRDLADRLTDEQIADMQRTEQSLPDDPNTVTAIAVYMAECNEIDAAHAHVAVPAGAVAVDGWTRSTRTGEWTRPIEWQRFNRSGDDMAVAIDGVQRLDGSYTRQITVYGENGELTSVAARDMAEALIAAADALDQLDGNPWPVDSATRPCCGGIGRHAPDCRR